MKHSLQIGVAVIAVAFAPGCGSALDTDVAQESAEAEAHSNEGSDAEALTQSAEVSSYDDTAASEESAGETSSAINIVTRQLNMDSLHRYDYDGNGGPGNGGGGGPGNGGDHGTIGVTVDQGKVGVDVEGNLGGNGNVNARGKVGVTVDNGKVNVSGTVRVRLGEGGGGGTGTSGSFGGFHSGGFGNGGFSGGGFGGFSGGGFGRL